MPLRRKTVAAVVLAGVALLACSDLGEFACTGEREAEGRCGWSDQHEGTLDEGECDHCAACLVSHGHLVSLLPQSASLHRPLASVSVSPALAATPDEPRARLFFHPPLA